MTPPNSKANAGRKRPVKIDEINPIIRMHFYFFVRYLYSFRNGASYRAADYSFLGGSVTGML